MDAFLVDKNNSVICAIIDDRPFFSQSAAISHISLIYLVPQEEAFEYIKAMPRYMADLFTTMYKVTDACNLTSNQYGELIDKGRNTPGSFWCDFHGIDNTTKEKS